MTTNSLWCVGICWGDGTHSYKVFDDEHQAETFFEAACQKKAAKAIAEVEIWEM